MKNKSNHKMNQAEFYSLPEVVAAQDMKTLKNSLPALPHSFNPNVKQEWLAIAYTKPNKETGKRRVLRWLRNDLTERSKVIDDEYAFVYWARIAKDKIKRDKLKSIQGFAFFMDNRLQYIDGPF